MSDLIAGLFFGGLFGLVIGAQLGVYLYRSGIRTIFPNWGKQS